mgnify:CR=1 FL=1
MIKKLLVLIPMLFTVGCATTMPEKESAKEYVKGSYAYSTQKTSKVLQESNCPLKKQQWENAGWKKVVKYANACVVLKNGQE